MSPNFKSTSFWVFIISLTAGIVCLWFCKMSSGDCAAMVGTITVGYFVNSGVKQIWGDKPQ